MTIQCLKKEAPIDLLLETLHNNKKYTRGIQGNVTLNITIDIAD